MGFDNNEMMIELFRSEVESHSESLSNALLILEKDPSAAEQLVGMMRAAHSIKGAARIVGVGPAVEVAHIMEDCFVAAQRGEVQLESHHVDLLLGGVDLLVRIANETKSPNPDWDTMQPDVKSIVAGVCDILKRAAPAPQTSQKIVTEKSVPAVTATPEQPRTDVLKSPPPSSTVPLVSRTSSMRTDASAVAPGNSVSTGASPIRSSPKVSASLAPESAAPHTAAVASSMDRMECEALRHKLLEAIRDKQQCVVLDLTNTKVIEPIGLAFLSACHAYLGQHGSTLQIRNASQQLKALLSVCSLGSLVVD